MTDLDTRIAALREAVGKMTPGEWISRTGLYGSSITSDDGSIAHCRVRKKRGQTGNPRTVLQAGTDALGMCALRNNAMGVIEEQAAEIERLRMCLYDEQDGITGTLRTDEIERLRARVAELERDPYASKCHNTAMTHYQEVGPTPLRGRVTRRDE